MFKGCVGDEERVWGRKVDLKGCGQETADGFGPMLCIVVLCVCVYFSPLDRCTQCEIGESVLFLIHSDLSLAFQKKIKLDENYF